MTNKKISRKSVNRSFKTIGLILIVYVLLVLYIPTLLKALFFDMDTNSKFLIFNKDSLFNMLLVILGTLLPFLLLKKAFISKRESRAEITFKEIFIQSLLLFTVSSISLFLTSTIGSYFGRSADLVGGIGVVVNKMVVDDIVYTLLFIIITPILEEIAFRGILLNYLSRYGKGFALIASSIIFAFAHSSFIEIFPAFILSYELGKIYLRYKSAKPCIWMHVIYNLFLFLLFVIQGKFSIWAAVILVIIYVSSFIALFAQKYTYIRVKNAPTTGRMIKMFFTCPTILICLLLMIVKTALTILLNIN